MHLCCDFVASKEIFAVVLGLIFCCWASKFEFRWNKFA